MASPAAATEQPVEEPQNYGIAGLDSIQLPEEAFGFQTPVEPPAADPAAPSEPPVGDGQAPPAGTEGEPSAPQPSEDETAFQARLDEAVHARERELFAKWEQTRLAGELQRQREADTQARRDLVLQAANGDLDAQAKLADDEANKVLQEQHYARIEAMLRQQADEVLNATAPEDPNIRAKLDWRNYQRIPEWVNAHRDVAAQQAVEAFKAKELPALREALRAEMRAEVRTEMPRPISTQPSNGGAYQPAPNYRSYAEAVTLHAEGKLNDREMVDARAAYIARRLPQGEEYALDVAFR